MLIFGFLLIAASHTSNPCHVRKAGSLFRQTKTAIPTSTKKPSEIADPSRVSVHSSGSGIITSCGSDGWGAGFGAGTVTETSAGVGAGVATGSVIAASAFFLLFLRFGSSI